ncbi:hypothetical protein T484DRAFT_1632044 [Baffinella frigidus]|nr:hypothetical protein T484DRAFT_1632044 [Cryptophyta sp. CCMP2293]
MADVDQVLRSAHKSGLLGLETQAVALFYDLDALKETLLALRVAFPPHFLHCIAVKANPLPFFLRGAVEMGFGLETASMGEVMMALQVGCKPDHIVFDSPAKGRRDIAFALKHGLQINADNFDELVRIDEEQQRIKGARGRFSDSAIGVRLNPLVGVGKIKALSVSGADSKFGIPFTAANRTKLLAAFGTYPWLTALHCHVGSQGCSLEQHAEGARTLHEFACHIRTEYGQMRIKSLDIGGGLPVNFADDSVAPSFAEYSAVLRTRVPALFEANKMYRVITEYGRSLSAKPGWVAAVVCLPSHLIHHHMMVPTKCGSDLFMRSCYCPGDFPTRITAHDGPTGEALVGVKGLEGAGEGRERREIVADVVGPLCFQGDKLKSANSMPQVREGDVIVVHDAGANTLSLWNRHCSRLAPPVLACPFLRAVRLR